MKKMPYLFVKIRDKFLLFSISKPSIRFQLIVSKKIIIMVLSLKVVKEILV